MREQLPPAGSARVPSSPSAPPQCINTSAGAATLPVPRPPLADAVAFYGPGPTFADALAHRGKEWLHAVVACTSLWEVIFVNPVKLNEPIPPLVRTAIACYPDRKLAIDGSTLTPSCRIEELRGARNLVCVGPTNGLVSVGPLGTLRSLQVLCLSHNMQLDDISGLRSLTLLQELDLSRCDNLEDLAPLASLKMLRKLDLSGNQKITDASDIGPLEQLQVLNLCGCSHLTDISSLRFLEKLEELDLSDCFQLVDIRALGSLVMLRKLVMVSCSRVTDLQPLGLLGESLIILNLHSCDPGLTTAEGLQTLTHLEELDLGSCSNLADVSALSTLSSLRRLDLSSTAVVDIASLATLTAHLEAIDFSFCRYLEDSTALDGLGNDAKLTTTGCHNQLKRGPGANTGWTSLNGAGLSGFFSASTTIPGDGDWTSPPSSSASGWF